MHFLKKHLSYFVLIVWLAISQLSAEDVPSGQRKSIISTDKAEEKHVTISAKPKKPSVSNHFQNENLHAEETTANVEAGQHSEAGKIKFSEQLPFDSLADKAVDMSEEMELQEPEAPQATAKEMEAERLYAEGIKALQKLNMQSSHVPMRYISNAAELGHVKASEAVAMASALGWGVVQSLPTAHAEFQRLAAEGNPRGQLGLALMHATGLVENGSIPHALTYFTFSALGDDELSEMALGYRYWAGISVVSNCEKALAYYRRVASKVAKTVSERAQDGGPTLTGPTVVRVHLLEEHEATLAIGPRRRGAAANYLINEDVLAYYKFVAENNNVSAQVAMGQLFYRGQHGVEIDHDKALHYFQRAAERGSSLAMAYLGEMYMVGSETVPADEQLALEYLQKSVAAANPVGQTSLGLAYLKGLAGLTRDPVKAIQYFIKAADQGWAEAQLQLGIIFLGTLGMKADYKLSLKYFTLASQQGNTLAFYHLGQMHATGLGVFRSCTTAAELFKNVAERGRWSQLLNSAYFAYWSGNYDEAFIQYLALAELGYEVAQSNAALLLEEGVLSVVPESEFHSRALLLWKRSANQGSTSSRVKLGDYYYYGLGTDINYELAIQEYRIASDVQRNAQAMFNLAYMHEQGLGFKRDIHLAKRFYDMAAESSTDAKIPVALVQAKLFIYFTMEYLNQYSWVSSITNFFAGSTHAPEVTIDNMTEGQHGNMDWDFYAIPLLAVILSAMLIFIRYRR